MASEFRLKEEDEADINNPPSGAFKYFHDENTGRFSCKDSSGTVVGFATTLDLVGLGRFQGAHDATAGVPVAGNFPSIEAGDYWRISVAGTITGVPVEDVFEVGDLIFSNIDSAAVAADFFGAQTNTDLADVATSGDHGDLVGLLDDDHTQYLTETRHDNLANDNPHTVTFTQASTADPGTDITALEAETLTDGSNADSLHTHAGLGVDEKVKVSANDSTAGFLGDKIVAGSTKLSVTELNDGADEDLSLDVVENQIDHDALNNYVAAEHIDWTQPGAGTIDASNYVDNDTTDHGALSGLGDDDHTQYHTDARGDIRYYQKSEFIDTFTGSPGEPIKTDSAGKVDGSLVDEADDDFSIRHPTTPAFDIIIDPDAGPSPLGASISKSGSSGFLHYMPNSNTPQITAGDPGAAPGANIWYMDTDNAGEMRLNTLAGAGAGADVVATDGAALRPDVDNTSDLGTSTERWKKLYGGIAEFKEGVGSGATANSAADEVVITSDQANAGMSILSTTGGNASIFLGNTDDGNDAGVLQYIGSVDELRFRIDNIIKVRIGTAVTRFENTLQLLDAAYQQAGLLTTDASGNVTVTQQRNNALAVGTIGSAANSADQNFQIDLSAFGIQVGDSVRLGNGLVRGDLSSDGTEYIEVGFGTAVAPKIRLGENGYDDTAIFRTDGGFIDQVETVVDIGAGVPGLQVYVSPSAAVNFSPVGMPSGWWWQFKIDVLIA